MALEGVSINELQSTLSATGKKWTAGETRQGDTAPIRLEETPTTGYRWELKNFNNDVLVFQSTDYLMDPGASIRVRRYAKFFVSGSKNRNGTGSTSASTIMGT